jgi:stage IV sporulation protein FB
MGSGRPPRRCPIGFMSWSFPLFRVFGIQVRAHWTLAILLAGQLLHGYAENMLRWRAIDVAILFASVLFHEFSHCWMARRRGGHAEEILLWPLGGLAYVGHSGSPRDELRVAGIGPLSSFALAGICLSVVIGTGGAWTWDYINPFDAWWFAGLTDAQNLLLHAFRLNVYLGLFNLIVPAYPLDGGRVLFAFLTMRHGRRRAAELTALIAIPIGVALAVWGVGQKELYLILIGAFVLIESFQLRWLLKIGDLEAHPGFGQVAEFDYLPDRPAPRKGWFARWRERRRARSEARRLAEEAVLRERVDLVLDKVSREGIGSLSPEERRILEEASRRSRVR